MASCGRNGAASLGLVEFHRSFLFKKRVTVVFSFMVGWAERGVFDVCFKNQRLYIPLYRFPCMLSSIKHLFRLLKSYINHLAGGFENVFSFPLPRKDCPSQWTD